MIIISSRWSGRCILFDRAYVDSSFLTDVVTLYKYVFIIIIIIIIIIKER